MVVLSRSLSSSNVLYCTSKSSLSVIRYQGGKQICRGSWSAFDRHDWNEGTLECTVWFVGCYPTLSEVMLVVAPKMFCHELGLYGNQTLSIEQKNDVRMKCVLYNLFQDLPTLPDRVSMLTLRPTGLSSCHRFLIPMAKRSSASSATPLYIVYYKSLGLEITKLLSSAGRDECNASGYFSCPCFCPLF